MPSYVKEVLIDISENTTESLAIDKGYNSDIALYMPGTMTGTAITFLVGDSLNGTYNALHDGTSAVSLTTAADLVVAPVGAAREAVRAARFIKLVSGSAELADRTIKVLITPRFSN
jgi:hypothetical protein